MTVKASENEHLLAIVVDVSPSFVRRIEGGEGSAYDWILKVIQDYGRSYPGEEGRIVIARIASGGRPLLWEGRPSHLRKSFRSSEAFREFLIRSGDGGATRLYEGLAETLEFVVDHPTVRSGQSDTDVIVVSDMVDTVDATGEHRKRLAASVRRLSATGAQLATYYVDQTAVPDIQSLLSENGYPGTYFTTLIDRYPEVPEFD